MDNIKNWIARVYDINNNKVDYPIMNRSEKEAKKLAELYVMDNDVSWSLIEYV